MEWTVFTALAAIVGLGVTVGAPIIKLNANITRLTVVLDTIRSKCQDLQLMDLYREAEAGGMYTITVGPLSAGDVASLKALCEQLQLVEMGLYKES